MSRVGLGLGQGWTIKSVNSLSVSILSPIGLDYRKNTRNFCENKYSSPKFLHENKNKVNFLLFCPLNQFFAVSL